MLAATSISSRWKFDIPPSHQVCYKDDGEWDIALQEGARTCRSAPQLRELFVIILRFCEPANPRQLFDNHWEEWCDDFKNAAGWRDLVSLSPDQSNQVLNQKILIQLKIQPTNFVINLRIFFISDESPCSFGPGAAVAKLGGSA